jgi:ribulose-phosphate 3-epimerase
MPPIKFSPSLLSADFGNLQKDVDRAEPFVDGFHFDVMDGQFVPNLTAGAPVLKCLHSKKPFDVHLMVEKPDVLLSDFAHAGASALCVHVEVCQHLHRTLQTIRELGMTAGVVLNPATSCESAKDAIALADYVLIMSVNPGFSGQSFIPDVLEKVQTIRKTFPEKDIQIDGGMSDTTVSLAIDAGANWIVSGSYFWDSSDFQVASQILRREKAPVF